MANRVGVLFCGKTQQDNRESNENYMKVEMESGILPGLPRFHEYGFFFVENELTSFS